MERRKRNESKMAKKRIKKSVETAFVTLIVFCLFFVHFYSLGVYAKKFEPVFFQQIDPRGLLSQPPLEKMVV